MGIAPDLALQFLEEQSNQINRSLSRYCGNEMPPQIRSSGDHVKVKFRSGPDISARGFTLNFDAGNFRIQVLHAVAKMFLDFTMNGIVP